MKVYPNLRNRAPNVDVRDIDARDFQLVPATKFMHHTIADGESPWWNPYSAAGSYGPETPADMKLSPFVLAVALFGASATAFTVVILLFVVIALYCLQRLVAYQLRLGRAAAIAACAVLLLPGGVARFMVALGAWAAFGSRRSCRRSCCSSSWSTWSC